MVPRTAYREYLTGPHWARTRSRYRRSRCVVCDRGPVEVHHRTYRRLGHERPADLVALCDRHHESLHLFARARRLSVERATGLYLAYACRLVTADAA